MQHQAVDELVKNLTAMGEQLRAPLEILALSKLAEEFYTKEQRTSLYADYQKLLEEDRLAFARMEEQYALLSGETWEERVAKHGPQVAAEQTAPSKEAREARVKAMHAVTAFEKEHGLLMRLLSAKASLSKGRYD